MSSSSHDYPADSERGHPLNRSFQAWFDAARMDRLELTIAEVAMAKRYQYVFVSGFHNEMMPLYFWGNIRELRRLGVAASQIHRIHPSSHATFQEIIEWLADTITRLITRNPIPLVFIGHSRGACATLAMALRGARKFHAHIEALILIQGPFGGTVIADYVTDRSKEFPNHWPTRRLGVARSLGTIERLALWLGLDRGLLDLTHESSRRFWRDCLDTCRADAEEYASEIERKSYFITSCIHPSRSRFPRSELGWILQESDGPNDGVVALADQSLEGIGTQIGPLNAAHTDLIWGLYSTSEARNDRRALTRSIIRMLAVQCRIGCQEQPGDTPR